MKTKLQIADVLGYLVFAAILLMAASLLAAIVINPEMANRL